MNSSRDLLRSLVKFQSPSLLVIRKCSGGSSSNSTKEVGKCEDGTLPEEPTNCCMSGCANCVWIEYARELTKIYRDGGEKARNLVISRITDPNIRIFIQMELKTLNLEEDKDTK